MEKIAVIDIETTGLSPRNDLILEIGIVELNLKSGEVCIIFDSLVREPLFSKKHRKSWIFENSNMSFEDVQNAPPFESFKKELQDIFNTYRISAFNKSFDLSFLKARGFKFPHELACIMLTSTNICKIPHINGRAGFKWPKAQEAWDFFFPNIDYIEKHRAADDAEHEAKILFELIKLGKFHL
jgi:DNA polymerase-3 subunit epsilon